MKAFLISPDHVSGCAVLSAIDVRPASSGGAQLEHLYELLECSLIEIVELQHPSPLAGHALVVDEEGLLKPHPGYLFMPRLHATPLAGKVLILGLATGSEGETMLSDAGASEDAVRGEIGRPYCSPHFARVALRQHEDAVRRRFPSAIVIPASGCIRSV